MVLFEDCHGVICFSRLGIRTWVPGYRPKYPEDWEHEALQALMMLAQGDIISGNRFVYRVITNYGLVETVKKTRGLPGGN